MNIQIADRSPTRAEAETALAVLKHWAGRATEDEIVGLGPAMADLVVQGGAALRRAYPEDFVADQAYIATLPDLQNGPASLIVGARQVIQHVGISNFRLPIRYRTRGSDQGYGGDLTLETSASSETVPVTEVSSARSPAAC